VSVLFKLREKFRPHGFSAFLAVVLLFFFALSLTGEKVPLNDGVGYDGSFYYNVAQNFSTDFWATGYDKFRIFRIFPFFLINLFFSFFSIEPSHANLMRSMYVLHVFNLVLQLVFFFKIVRLNAWKKTTTALIFGCFFFNYFILKSCGYEVFQTDAFACTIFLVSYYYLLRQKFIRAVSISFLGILTWPTITYTIWLLYFFKDKFPQSAPRLKFETGKAVSLVFPLMSAGAVATLYLLHKHALLESMLFTQVSIPLLFTGTVFWGIFLYLVLRSCDYRFHTPLTYIREFVHQSPWKSLAFVAIPFIAINLYLRAHTNDEFFFNETAFILQIFLRPLKYPLITPVAHVCYFGIVPLLVIFLFRDFSREIFNRSAGYALAFLAFLFFATDSESRHVIPLLPMVLVPLGCVLDKMDLSAKAVAALLALQIFLSHFYIPINVDGIAEAFANNDYSTVVAQRYFMNYGPWMSPKFYVIWSIITILAAVLVRFIIKRRKI